ncbi:hypothetical protein BJ165DRAFT_1039684 [Panaeolus papilionaceus]|nr:hypothetical protein BJ165DRAFT_1039684 [Panaeolus papilionaceus]
MSGAYASGFGGSPGFQRPQVAAPVPGMNYYSVPGASLAPGPQGSYGQLFAYSPFPSSQPPFVPSAPISSATSARHVQQSNLDDAVRGSGFAPSPQQGSSAQFMKTTKSGMHTTTSEWIYDQNRPPSESNVQRLSAPETRTTTAGGKKIWQINYGTNPQLGPLAPTSSLPPNASYQAIPNGVSDLPISKETIPRTETDFDITPKIFPRLQQAV